MPLRHSRQELQISTDEIVRLYLEEKLAPIVIARRIGCAEKTIIRRLTDRNVPLRNSAQAHRRATLNEDYFANLDTQEKAYWLGFIMADGYNYTGPKTPFIAINISSRDVEHLKKFAAALNYDGKIYYQQDKSVLGTIQHHSMIRISSTKLSHDLLALGVERAKSLTLRFPQISDEFVQSFLLGYFDGDGCIHIARKHRGLARLRAELIVTSQDAFLVGFRDTLQRFLQLPTANRIYKVKRANASMLKYGGSNMICRIGKFLYEKCPVWLERKRELFTELEVAQALPTLRRGPRNFSKEVEEEIVRLSQTQTLISVAGMFHTTIGNVRRLRARYSAASPS